MRVAAIDIGSNSIHLVVAQVEADGRFTVLDRAKENVRLGSRTLTEGRLPAEAMDLGLQTLAAYKMLAERQGATRIQAVATCAVREAANGGEFVKRAKDELGLRIDVVPGREEARLIYLGVAHALDLRHEPALIVDIGGGSVELILAENGEATSLHSLKLGVTRLAEQFLDADPPTPKALRALDAHVAAEIEPVVGRFRKRGVRRVIGTSGTMLNVIALAGHRRGTPPEGHLDGFEVGADEVAVLRRVLQKADRRTRAQMKGLDAKRVDTILPGVVVADAVLRTLRAVQLVGCTWSLREGVLLDFIARHPRKIADADHIASPRRRSVARLRRRFGDYAGHAEKVQSLAEQLFDQLYLALDLPPESRELLGYAALLHDVGHHIRHKDHQHHSYYLITNCEMLGFRRDEIEIIALAARYHRKGLPKDTDPEMLPLTKQDRRTVRGLTALLRLADGLDRTHYGVVREVSAERRGRRLVFTLRTGGDDAGMEVWEGRRRAALLAQLLDCDVDFAVDAAADERRAPRRAGRAG